MRYLVQRGLENNLFNKNKSIKKAFDSKLF